jgi:hypothetical protein
LPGEADGSRDQTGFNNNDEHQGRYARYSSNTWTDSSGGVLSDVDDVEDRSEYVEEYNRLAKKVRPTQIAPKSRLMLSSMVCDCSCQMHMSSTM